MDLLYAVNQLVTTVISGADFWYVPSVVVLQQNTKGPQLVAENWIGGIFSDPAEAGQAAKEQAKLLMSDCWHFEEKKVAEWLPVCHIGRLVLEPPFRDRHLIYLRVTQWQSTELVKLTTSHLRRAYF